MKAKAYFEEFNPKFQHARAFMNAEEFDAACKEVMAQFGKECKDLATKRNVKTGHALVAVVEETNDKWNALVSLFEKEYGESPILRNGFREAFKAMDKDRNGCYTQIEAYVKEDKMNEKVFMSTIAKELNARNG